VDRVLSLPDADFLNIGKVFTKKLTKGKTNFETKRCAKCGAAVFTDKLKEGNGGKLLCIPCSV